MKKKQQNNVDVIRFIDNFNPKMIHQDRTTIIKENKFFHFPLQIGLLRFSNILYDIIQMCISFFFSSFQMKNKITDRFIIDCTTKHSTIPHNNIIEQRHFWSSRIIWIFGWLSNIVITYSQYNDWQRYVDMTQQKSKF